MKGQQKMSLFARKKNALATKNITSLVFTVWAVNDGEVMIYP